MTADLLNSLAAAQQNTYLPDPTAASRFEVAGDIANQRIRYTVYLSTAWPTIHRAACEEM